MPDTLQPTPTAVERYFFTPLYYPRSAFSVIWWWERRRMAYNVCVGTGGLLSLGVMGLLARSPFETVFTPQIVFGVLVYGIAANLCYSLGWMADLFLRRTLGIRAPDIGPVLLRYGFAFSMGLTLLPIPVAIAARLVTAVLGIGHG